MFKALVLNILGAIAGLWIASKLISDVQIQGPVFVVLVAGTLLGLLHTIFKPILFIFTFPLRLLTFGVFGFIIHIGLVFLVDIGTDLVFPRAFEIKGLFPLASTAFLVWGSLLFVSFFGGRLR